MDKNKKPVKASQGNLFNTGEQEQKNRTWISHLQLWTKF